MRQHHLEELYRLEVIAIAISTKNALPQRSQSQHYRSAHGKELVSGLKWVCMALFAIMA